MTIEPLNPKILGQLLLMQSIVINLPDKKSIFSFVCKGLLDIPGILKVDYFDSSPKEVDNSSFQERIPVFLGNSYFGELVVNLSDIELYRPYNDYLKNFIFMIAVVLEERNQRQLNEENQLLLEQRILERTYELKEKSEEIEAQNEEYLQINEELFQKNQELLLSKQELLIAKEQAEESQKAYKDVVETISDIITVVDKNGKINFINHSSTYFYGIPPTECLGKSAFDFIYQEDKEYTQNKFAEWLLSSESNFYFENRQINVSGKILHTLWNIHIERNNSEIVKITSIGRDISEQKKINEELHKAKEQAEESDRLKSAFLANMSHEIRTPMNGILGFSGLLKEPELSGELQQKYIQIIETSGARMLNILNDIISISKIESGILDINPSETNLNNQLQFVYDSLKLDADNKKLNLSYNCALPAKEAIINTDSEKLFGILSNLVKNAIKYTQTGTIEFGYTNTGKDFEFYVKDTGIGIPKERQEAIFERFIQGDITNKMAQQGAGLGLAISKAYVEILGGRIWVVSEESEGSTFFFTLPCNMDKDRKVKISKSVLSENEDKPRIPENLGLKVLIAEDDETSEILISIKLAKFSKEILKVTTGINAIETCRQHPDIDLVLMDIQMPGMNGYEATRKIREFNKDVIILAQTAFALTGDREKAIEAGCNDYISKPINQDELLTLLQTYFK